MCAVVIVMTVVIVVIVVSLAVVVATASASVIGARLRDPGSADRQGAADSGNRENS